jgi:hypothetical protein
MMIHGSNIRLNVCVFYHGIGTRTVGMDNLPEMRSTIEALEFDHDLFRLYPGGPLIDPVAVLEDEDRTRAFHARLQKPTGSRRKIRTTADRVVEHGSLARTSKKRK